MTPDQRIDAIARQTRFGSVALVLDLRNKDAAEALAEVKNKKALNVAKPARGLKAPYVVLAGQLHLSKGGVFTCVCPTDDIMAVCDAAAIAAGQLAEVGESMSMWVIIGTDELRKQVGDMLTAISATQGTA